MAGHTALDLYRFVLEDKRPGLIGVTLKTDCVLGRRGAQLPRQESAVGIVAVAAFHQPFIYAVVEGPVKLLLGFQVAAVAQLRLLLLHQELAFFRVVRIVTIRAANIILQVRRAPKIAVLFTVLVAHQASRADVFRRSILERENLAFVSAAIHVGLARAMAGFATVPFRPLPSIQRGGEVGRILVVFKKILRRHVFVARFTRFRTNVERRIRWLRVGFCLFGLTGGRRSLRQKRTCGGEGQ